MSLFAAIQAVAQSITAICNFLCTPEGQLLLKASRENQAVFESHMAKAVAWLEGTAQRIAAGIEK